MPAHNERITENLVRDELRRLGYYKPSAKIVVEEQKSDIEAVKRLMRAASKSGHGGSGSPEFIVSAKANPDFLLVVECKADARDHTSPRLKGGKLGDEEEEDYAKRVQKYGVDGVLHYARFLSKEFNVVAVAVSGSAKGSTQFSAHLHPKGEDDPKPLKTKDGVSIDRLATWADFIEHGTFDPTVQRIRSDELMAFSRDLHNFMRDHAKLTESEKPLMVSGTLIALRNKAFAKSFDAYEPQDLQNEWLEVIAKEIHKADIPQAKKEKMVQPYSTIAG